MNEQHNTPQKDPFQKTKTTMTRLHEEALRSGLGFVDSDNNTDASQWSSNEWPPLLGGWRWSHASIVLDHPEEDDKAQTVVVLGGNKQG